MPSGITRDADAGIRLLEARDDRYRNGGAGFVIDQATMLADGFRIGQ